MRKVANCPACGRDGPRQVASLDSQRRERFIEYDRRKYGGLLATWLDEVTPAVVRCDACGHCWYPQQPEPRQLSGMYAAARPIINIDKPVPRTPTERMVKEMERLRLLVGHAATQPTLLDYGSGFGRWARAATQVGFRVTAYEPSVTRSEEDATPFELVSNLDALGGRRFDFIQLEQVLEHVPDPLETLRSIRKSCHAATLLRCTVPNVLRTAEGARIWEVWPFDGRSVHTLAPFEHLHGFTPRSLRAVAGRAGFRLLSGWRAVRFFPQWHLRRLAGRVRASWDTTLILLRPA